MTGLVVCRWWLGLEWLIPPPVGAFAGRSGAWRHRGWGSVRWAGQRSWAQRSAGAVGDGELVCGSGDGDDAPMVQPMMIGAEQHEVVQLGRPAVFPVPDVVGVQTAGGPAAGHRAGAVAVLEGTAQPAADQPRRPPRADDLPVTFEPHLTGGITGQVSAIGLGEQRTQMQRSDALLDVEMHDHGGVLPVGPASHLGVPAGLDQTHERRAGARQRRR